ncbi:MAG: hypothetical protein JO057_24040 [Chloroflexi bacterium]|nr:hypothetical protein [Chloroflexota bacterium]
MHEPSEAAQSDFTHMANLEITLGGVAFPYGFPPGPGLLERRGRAHLLQRKL